MSLSAIYVTGTDTGIGKTFVSCTLLHTLRTRGQRAVGMKPVASGCTYSAAGWRNEDALALQAASDPTPPYDLINPYALPAPVAPEIAATKAGITLTLEPLSTAFTQLRAQADVVVVEGVGGWATPLNATLDQATLVRALDIPVVLVVGLRLGCLNHARLSTAAIMADGLRCIGWIANTIDPHMVRIEENLALLRQRLPIPYWGHLPHTPGINPAALATVLNPQEG
ncbi:MAG TPA: dethiobiotin synthase [Xylella taiwanensis]